MSILSQVTTGKLVKPFLLILHGPPGVGKSTFAAHAPNPIFLGAEDGTSNLDVSRLSTLDSLTKFREALKALSTEKHSYKTLVIDSLDWLEPLIWSHVANAHKVAHIEEIGYGKGYLFALKLWQEIIEDLKLLRDKNGMNVVAIAHSLIKNITDPSTNQSYDRFVLKLNEKASSLWKEFVDGIFFCTYEVHTKSENGKTKAFSTGERVMYTEWRSGMEAKNRYGLPFKMPLSYEAFEAALKSGSGQSLEEIHESLKELLKVITDKKTIEASEKFILENKDNAPQLLKIKQRLEILAQTK